MRKYAAYLLRRLRTVLRGRTPCLVPLCGRPGVALPGLCVRHKGEALLARRRHAPFHERFRRRTTA
jgi:hypothetical protein